MPIRSLDPRSDHAIVAAFFAAIGDYVQLERDAPADAAVVEEFFHDAPPGCDPAASHRLGLFEDDRLIALAEMASGYPNPTDAYIGFLAVIPAARGSGAGRRLLHHLETLARGQNAPQICLAVLDANPRGRAFWEREGFVLALPNRSVTIGSKTQIAHRLHKPL